MRKVKVEETIDLLKALQTKSPSFKSLGQRNLRMLKDFQNHTHKHTKPIEKYLQRALNECQNCPELREFMKQFDFDNK